MRIRRSNLTVLFNRLYDAGHTSVSISHPSADIGELVTIDLEDRGRCTIRFDADRDDYAAATESVRSSHAEAVYDDLPEPDQYVKAIMASGVVPIANEAEVQQFLDRYGDPDLLAGHPPVVAGFDTNLLAWRIDEILGLRDAAGGIGYVNGFVLATGVRDELDWEHKCHDTDPFVDAFGDAYEEYWNQPLGATRIGRLGLLNYRKIRDIEEGAEIRSESGDEAIIRAYDDYDDTHRSDVLLFSNDRNFIERARSHTLLAQHVELPRELPDSAPATWRQAEFLLHLLAVVFGVLETPTTTVHGIWRGKDGADWQHERLKLDCRSSTLEPQIEADLSIIETYEDLEVR